MFSLSRKLLTVYCKVSGHASHMSLKICLNSKRIKGLSGIFHCVFSQEICLINHNMPTLSLIKIHWSSGFCPLKKKSQFKKVGITVEV